MNVLEVNGLCKSYPGFSVSDISFCVKSGRVMGFIGRNGAGKTTTLKAVMNMIPTTGGSIKFFGKDINENEETVRQRTGYAAGATGYYMKKKISKLLDITKRFYDNWDEDVCRKYMQLFSLDENKTPSELSEGMKVKLNLVIALSHGSELLILDEPTSGLDPVSRAELLEIFRYLKSRGIAILFSTHITSDLDKCADDITYIKNGRIVYTGDLDGFASGENINDVMMRHEMEEYIEKFAV